MRYEVVAASFVDPGRAGARIWAQLSQVSAGRDDWAFAREKAGIETSAYSDMHAGELETSILLHAHPDLIRPGYETADHLAEDRRHMLTLGLAPYTESGVIGRPSLASARKGELLLAGLVDSFRHYLDLFGGLGTA